METRLRGDLGVEVSGVSVQELSVASAAQLVGWVHEHKLVVLSGQNVDEADYVRFARKLGKPQVYFQANYHHPSHPEIFVSSNVELKKGEKFGVKATGRYWHTDCAFEANPLPLTMVTPRLIPKGARGTLYVDMERVFERLPEDMKEFVLNHRAVHEGKWRYKVQPSDVDRAVIDILADIEKRVPPMTHPAAIRHPVRNRMALYVSEGFTTGFADLEEKESKAWLARILEFVQRPEHVVRVPWREGDILLWDNRVLIHRAEYASINEPSLSYRIGVYDGFPFYVKPAQSHDAGGDASKFAPATQPS